MLDFSLSVYLFLKKNIYVIIRKNNDSKKHQTRELLNNIVAYLENYISQERNESFHSRLQLYEIEELNDFLVDTRRTLEKIDKVMELIEY